MKKRTVFENSIDNARKTIINFFLPVKALFI